MSPDYRLHYAPDNASLVIRLALEELRLPYDTALVDRRAGAQRSPAYLKLNPHGLIPVLETPEGPLFETAAILLWLADRHGGLAPGVDNPERGRFLKWLFFASNTLHPALRMMFYPEKYIGPDESQQADLRRHMQGELARHLDKFEALVATSPPWLGGAQASALDFYIACMLRWMALYPAGQTAWFTLRNWPHLQTLLARLERCATVLRAIQAEGLGPTPFTAPDYAAPPEGSAI